MMPVLLCIGHLPQKQVWSFPCSLQLFQRFHLQFVAAVHLSYNPLESHLAPCEALERHLAKEVRPAKHARRADLRDSKMYRNNLQTVFTSLKISLNVVWPCIPEISNFWSQNQAVASFHAQNHLASAIERRSLAMANSRAVSPRACQQSDWIAGMYCKKNQERCRDLGVNHGQDSRSQWISISKVSSKIIQPRSNDMTTEIATFGVSQPCCWCCLGSVCHSLVLVAVPSKCSSWLRHHYRIKSLECWRFHDERQVRTQFDRDTEALESSHPTRDLAQMPGLPSESAKWQWPTWVSENKNIKNVYSLFDGTNQ